MYALGDAANINDQDGKHLPQLGSVAQQSGTWAGRNILADLDGKERTPFHYRDKGIMAMIGHNAAVASLSPAAGQALRSFFDSGLERLAGDDHVHLGRVVVAEGPLAPRP